MTTQDPDHVNAKTDIANQIADAVERYLVDLQAATGVPTAVLLAGAHAGLVVTMAAELGGPMTAQACERAAARVRHLPSLAACSLAFAAPAGRA